MAKEKNRLAEALYVCLIRVRTVVTVSNRWYFVNLKCGDSLGTVSNVAADADVETIAHVFSEFKYD